MSDLTGLSSYTDYMTDTNRVAAENLQKQLEESAKAKENEALFDACKQFEAYFLEQVFKAMQKMVPESDHQSSYTKQMQSYFKDEMVQKLAKDSTETNGLGLAQTLYEQMKRNYNL